MGVSGKGMALLERKTLVWAILLPVMKQRCRKCPGILSKKTA
jgi:hypothetical protein